jgi:hypothetical protein
MARSDPNLWQIPKWHPDWDGDFTFAGLRTFANVLLARTDLDARLTIIEEGYAHLEVLSGTVRIGLVYVNRGDDCAVPQFTVYAGAGDDDLTTINVLAAVRFLDTHRMRFPED